MKLHISLLASVLLLSACGGAAPAASSLPPSPSAPAAASAPASKPAASGAAPASAASASASPVPSAPASAGSVAGAASKPAAAGGAAAASTAPAASGAAAKPAASAAPKLVSVQMPAPPDDVPVTLKGAGTAFVINDVSEQTCKPQAVCTGQMVPKIAAFLTKARAAGVYVVYTTPPTGSPPLPEVAPAPGDPVVKGDGQDRFYNTNLDSLLKAKNISTVILAGWRIDGSVIYTAVGASLRGYTVVVPDDTTSASTDYDIAIGKYQLLTQLNNNAANEPLKAKAVTISRTDLITLQ